jgi:HAE1 family hydrophobic/amphiphilic exporter-1
MGTRSGDDARVGELVGLLNASIQGIPGTFAFARQTSLFEQQGMSGSRTIDIEIRGGDLLRIVPIARRVFGQVRGMYEGSQVRPIPTSGLDLSAPEVHILPRWDRAADLGVTAIDLGYSVNSLVDGAYAGDYFTGGDRIDLTIKGVERYAKRLQDLRDLPIATPSGNLVPLGAVADVELASGPEQIDRRERERAVTIQLQPPEEVGLESAIRRVEREVVEPLRADGTLGADTRITLGGTADKLAATWGELSWNLLLAVVITYLLMAALFESWLYPLVVITSVPLGAVGGLVGLWLLNRVTYQPLDVLTMVGFVILIGTVVNNAILVVHQSLNHMRVDGMDPPSAVRASVRNRMRPIFMTLLTTICGLFPLVLFPGAGSELYRGIGSILIGGLLVSTFFTLFLIPVLFRLTLALKETLVRWLRLAPAQADD